MKKIIVKIIALILIILFVPLTLVGMGFGLPPQYGDTYYAALAPMFHRLKRKEGKRLIVVGGSAVAFGLRGDLIESELENITVCPFGLYGAIGTKTMMDLSKVNVHEGDIVLLAPEQGRQSQSLYFNGEHVWRAADSDFNILKYIAKENRGSMVGTFNGYVSQKISYLNGKAPLPEGVYAKRSFDENCMMIYDRPHNVMLGGYDSGDRISFDPSITSDDFAAYANKYQSFVSSRGATLLFAFAPVNASALQTGTKEEDVDAFYDSLKEKLDFDILGSPHSYILDSEWFFDSNVHCNSAGAQFYTRQLVKDLKTYLCDASSTDIAIPQKPITPENQPDLDADNTDAQYFKYEAQGNGFKIVGLTQEGMHRTQIIVPTVYDGKAVISFESSVFANNVAIEQISLQQNIRSIEDGSFDGCENLKRLYMAAEAKPSDCRVYGGLFSGADNCRVYVKSAMLAQYATDYFWSRYASRLTGY